MNAENAFATLKDFCENRLSPRQALACLREGAEISVVIGESVHCAIYRKGQLPVIEQRQAQDPDLVFRLPPKSVHFLCRQTPDELSKIGVNLLTEVMRGRVRVQIPAKIMRLISNGYLDLLRKGGAPVMAHLAQHGIGSVPKFVGAIKRMREKC
jgi:hypothetical protein